jgi:putative transposase
MYPTDMGGGLDHQQQEHTYRITSQKAHTLQGWDECDIFIYTIDISISMPRGYSRENTCVHLMNYHFVFCPKYRKPILINKVKSRLEELIAEKADDLDCEIIDLQVMPDHVHLFIAAKPPLSPNRIIAQIKGFSSKKLREEFVSLKHSLPSLWTRSYFVSTAGNVSSDTIQRYIEEQTGK